jgi:hypothetical protein
MVNVLQNVLPERNHRKLPKNELSSEVNVIGCSWVEYVLLSQTGIFVLGPFGRDMVGMKK